MKKSPLTTKLVEELEVMERTVDILNIVEEEQPVGITKLSSMLNLPEHKVRYSLRMLQKEGVIEPTPGGATISSNHENFIAHLKEILIELDSTMKRIRNVLESDL